MDTELTALEWYLIDLMTQLEKSQRSAALQESDCDPLLDPDRVGKRICDGFALLAQGGENG